MVYQRGTYSRPGTSGTQKAIINDNQIQGYIQTQYKMLGSIYLKVRELCTKVVLTEK